MISLNLEAMDKAQLSKGSPEALIEWPLYDPRDLPLNVVHFGPGAFHRAHQVDVFDQINAHDPKWGIVGVSLHSKDVKERLSPQDGLYSLNILDESPRIKILGALRQILWAPEDPQRVIDLLAEPQIKLVMSTVTEKGYCLDPQGELDLHHPDIVHDLAHPEAPKSFIGYLAYGMMLRHERGLKPFMVLPCDNLAQNGPKLKLALLDFIRHQRPGLMIDFICPSTMVDSITPATDDALRQAFSAKTGLVDAWPIQREAFSQWVIESHEFEGGPDWAKASVVLTPDLKLFEQAKLRLLNGPHSALAYMGLLRGHQSVSEAMKDEGLRAFIYEMMLSEILPTLRPISGFDLRAYADAIIKRFENQALVHQLSQIAWDGSQKLPIRLVATLNDGLELGLMPHRILEALAAWIAFIEVKSQSSDPLIDPLAERLREAAKLLDKQGLEGFLDKIPLLPQSLRQNKGVIEGLQSAFERQRQKPEIHKTAATKPQRQKASLGL